MAKPKEEKREPTKMESVSILSIKDSDDIFADNIMANCFLGNEADSKKEVTRRERYLGISKKIKNAMRRDPNRKDFLTMPGFISMLPYHLCETITSRFFNSIAAPLGGYVSAEAPRSAEAEAKAPLFESYFNANFHDDEFLNDNIYEICRGTVRSGYWFIGIDWDYKESVTRIEEPFFEWDSNTLNFKTNVRYRTENVVLRDAPRIRSVDILNCGMPVGTKRLNDDGTIFVERCFFPRFQLEFFEQIGRIGKRAGGKSFTRLTKEEIGDFHRNKYQDPNVLSYFSRMYDTELNHRLGFDHKYYKFIVDKIYVYSTWENKTIEYWSVNGYIICKREWYGYKIPYEQTTYTQLDTTYKGLGLFESLEDVFTEKDILLQFKIAQARKAGNQVLLMSEKMLNDKSERNLDRALSAGGVVGVAKGDSEWPISQQIVQFSLTDGKSLSTLNDMLKDLDNQAQQQSSANVMEINPASVGSNVRSTGIVDALASQSGGISKMRDTLMVSTWTRVFEQCKWLTYHLQGTSQQTQVREVKDNKITNTFQTLTPEDFKLLPYIKLRPQGNIRPMRQAMAQSIIQLTEMAFRTVGQPGAPNPIDLLNLAVKKTLDAEDITFLQQRGVIAQTAPPVGEQAAV